MTSCHSGNFWLKMCRITWRHMGTSKILLKYPTAQYGRILSSLCSQNRGNVHNRLDISFGTDRGRWRCWIKSRMACVFFRWWTKRLRNFRTWGRLIWSRRDRVFRHVCASWFRKECIDHILVLRSRVYKLDGPSK